MFNFKRINTTTNSLILILTLLFFINFKLTKAIGFEKDNDEVRISKRQASNNDGSDAKVSLSGNRPKVVKLNGPIMPIKMFSSSRAQASASSETQNLRPSNIDNNKSSADDSVDDYSDRPERKKNNNSNKKKKPTSGLTAEPVRKYDKNGFVQYEREYFDDDDDVYECYEYYDDNNDRNKLYSMATQPMRQFGRIMDKMFGQISSTSSNYRDDDDDNYKPSGAVMSSSFSGGNDYSGIMSALTNRNGRTSGVVAETRNGRTKTTRIGEGQDDDDEDD